MAGGACLGAAHHRGQHHDRSLDQRCHPCASGQAHFFHRALSDRGHQGQLRIGSVEKLDALRPKHLFGGTFALAVIAIVDPGAIREVDFFNVRRIALEVEFFNRIDPDLALVHLSVTDCFRIVPMTFSSPLGRPLRATAHGRDSLLADVGNMAIRRDRQVPGNEIQSASICPRPIAA